MSKTRDSKRSTKPTDRSQKSATNYLNTIAILEKRLKIQQLISELSAVFINLPSRDLAEQINRALKQIAKFLDLQRCTFGEFSKDLRVLNITHSYSAPNIAPTLKVIEASSLPLYTQMLLQGKNVVYENTADLPDEAKAEREYCLKIGLKSHLAIPISIGGSPICALGFSSFYAFQTWPEEMIESFRRLTEIFAHAIYRKRSEDKLQKSYQEIKQLKDRLEIETRYLRSEININLNLGEIVGKSKAMQSVIKQVEQVAPIRSTVLITGETGVGKEVVARAIHRISPCNVRAMVKVNCASLPSTLIESELFGREKGAYTGALSKQPGRFEIADGCTIFLDEIGELSTEIQAKLLRVLQDGEFERLGSSKTIKVDVRVIAATNRNLTEAVRQGKFREDLYYRLRVFPIEVPPLRKRPEDIPQLVWAFIDEFAKKMGKKTPALHKRTMESLMRYTWPGNVRELRNILEHAMIINNGSALQVQLPKNLGKETSTLLTLEESEQRHIVETLESTQWRVKGKNGAAELLGLHPSTLHSKMRKLKIPFLREKDDISS